MLKLCSILTYYAQIMPNYLCLSSHALLIISSLWIDNKWLKHKLVKLHITERSIYSNRTVSYMIVLLELLTVLLEYIDLSVIAAKDSYYYTNILPIMLALCSMLSGTYYAHNYASIIGGSLVIEKC